MKINFTTFFRRGVGVTIISPGPAQTFGLNKAALKMVAGFPRGFIDRAVIDESELNVFTFKIHDAIRILTPESPAVLPDFVSEGNSGHTFIKGCLADVCRDLQKVVNGNLPWQPAQKCAVTDVYELHVSLNRMGSMGLESQAVEGISPDELALFFKFETPSFISPRWSILLGIKMKPPLEILI